MMGLEKAVSVGDSFLLVDIDDIYLFIVALLFQILAMSGIIFASIHMPPGRLFWAGMGITWLMIIMAAFTLFAAFYNLFREWGQDP